MSAQPEPIEASTVSCDVAIVGYGPVGSVLAILLGQLGHRVVVLERWLEPYPLPRAVHFDHEVGRILQGCGIGAELAGISEAADVYEWRNAAGTTLLRFGRVGAGPSGWPESSMFNQPALEALLAERARRLPGIEVHRGVEVTGIDPSDDHVLVTGTGADGRPVAVRAPFAIGCDGANSRVRDLIGAPVQDLGFFYDWLIVDVVLHEPRVFDPVNLQVCDPARPTTVVSGGPGRRRWEFMRLPHEDLGELDDEARAWELLADWDVTPENATLERHAVYTFNARYAERWRVGRVLLAGDAAHQMPPFAGQGMCAGVRDAANLAWKLDLVLTDRSPDRLLDTYTEERMPEVQAAIDLSMELGKVICVPDPAEAAARDEAMSAAVGPELVEVPGVPPMVAGVRDPEAGHAGHPFVQGVVEQDGRRGLLDDICGPGWKLVTIVGDPDGAEPVEGEVVAWFASIGGRVIALGAPGQPVDVAGTYAGWFAGHEARWALQRPDFRLYGSASGAREAEALLRHLRLQLEPTPGPTQNPTNPPATTSTTPPGARS